MKTSRLSAFFQSLLVPAVLVGLGAISWFISTTFLEPESLRLDEAQSLWQTAKSLPATLTVVAQDVHMPMYHIILHYWTLLFGNDVATDRLLSFIFFAATIPVVYLLAKEIIRKNFALFATALFALSPFVLWYATEARMYTLLALFSALNQLFFIRILKRKKGAWVGYVISAMLGAYSHYFFLFNLVAQALFYLYNRKAFAKGSFKKFVLTVIATGLFIAPWLIFFFKQGAASNTRPLIADPSAIDFFNVYSQFLFGFQNDAINTILVSFWPLTVVIGFFLVKRRVKTDLSTQYIAWAAFAPVLIAFFLSFIVSPFFLSRYMIAAAIPLYILITWILSVQTKQVAVIIASILIALTLGMQVIQNRSPMMPLRESYASVVNDISTEATPSDLIVMSSPFTVYPVEYYYKGTSQIRTLPVWDRQNPGPIPGFDRKALPGQVDQLAAGHQKFYFIYSHDQGYEQDIKDYLDSRFTVVSHKQYSNDLTMYVYQINN